MARSRIAPAFSPIELRGTIAEFLPTRGLPLMAKHRWSDRMLAIVMLLMVWSPAAALKDRFSEARGALIHMYPSRKRPGKSFAGFMKIIARHSQRLVALIASDLRGSLPERLGKHWRIGRWLAFTVDGTMIDCPRTRANEEHFKSGDTRQRHKAAKYKHEKGGKHQKGKGQKGDKRPKGGRHKSPKGGKNHSAPQMLLVCLIHLGSGILWSWRRDTAQGSERGLLRQLLADLPPMALLVADAGFVGYELLRAIFQQGHSILMRVGSNVTFIEKFGYEIEELRHGRVYLWPKTMRQSGQSPLLLRKIEVIDPRRNRRMCLLTNVLSISDLSDAQAIELYCRRWGVELFYRAIKQTLGRRKMLSDSPLHAQVELDWSVLGHGLLSLLHWQEQKKKLPAHQGLAQALRIVRQAMRGGGADRRSLRRQLRDIKPDDYVRRSSKKARDWPHKKNDPPCGMPKVRMATTQEIRMAKALHAQKLAA